VTFRIEYLRETTVEDSVCHAVISSGKTLADAEAEAISRADEAQQRGATGFQIRHLNAVVVAIAEFADPSPIGDGASA